MALPPCRATLAAGRHAARNTTTLCLRSLSTAESSYKTANTMPQDGSGSVGRWNQTPPAMRAPMRMNFAKHEHNRVWIVNKDPKRLDDMYDRLLGPGGCEMLPDELKWLAVTHKSFDYGRRGFNDRLALLGRLTLIMEATKDIVSKPPLAKQTAPDANAKLPTQQSRLDAVDNLSHTGPKDLASVDKLYKLATKMGILSVMRWKPRLTQELEQSGVQTVLGGALLAIIGAVVLQHGSVVASKIVRERILARLARL
ncbi:ribonuclease-III-like domain-containing protein [Hirsutella rhossiliensis]|uniref:Ribonuclease-III-like domain-containing protein n=1 Tax=Hirsutella rhossiliensis TaxID=111463 RepID=A0A9P8SMZ1_9HYPO|nr:ribonuclease-III-like domain-containing protein [Hirsutella rhossiliensis]KAH0967819.1 ribonuclease-III-like domain-containing protein [Hirsutella rhossiliensis]